MKAWMALAARCALAAAASGGLAAGAQAQVRWDLPSGYPQSNFHTENLAQFAADVDAATAGKLKITIHSNGSLFKANEIKRAVQGGQAPLGEVFISNHANEDPVFGLDALPFIANGYGDARKLWQVSRPAIESKLAKQGLRVLYSVAWQPGGIYSIKPLQSAADLKGSKWRAYNSVSSRIAELVGAQPVTIQAAELSQALATGAVQSFTTSSATGYDSKAWEQVKNFYDVNMSLPKNIVVVNEKAFAALDAPTQAAVLKAAAAAEDRGWKASEEKNKWYLEQLTRNGMQVHRPSPQFQSELRKVGDTMLADWLKSAGSDGQSIIQAYGR
jgi:TRAP-type transport system periplasmic protein